MASTSDVSRLSDDRPIIVGLKNAQSQHGVVGAISEDSVDEPGVRQTTASRLHADRTAGCDRDHRRLDRAACCRPFSRRARLRGGSQCTNNLKQLGLGLHNYHTSWNSFPVGFLYAYQGVLPNSSPLQYRWSVLAQMAPQLEQANIFNALNFNFPIAHMPTGGPTPFWPYFPANTTAMATQVAIFLCPERRRTATGRRHGSDQLRVLRGRRCQRRRCHQRRWSVHPGPGRIDGQHHRRLEPDGRGFGASARDRRALFAACIDAGAHTLGSGHGTRRGGPFDRRAVCSLRRDGWLLNSGSSWWDGNYQNALYNHYLPPNADRPDCIVYHNPGWKAARSFHPGGVNVLYCDGHVVIREKLGQSGRLASDQHPGRRRGGVGGRALINARYDRGRS